MDYLNRSLSNLFRRFFGKFKTSKGHSEINWPLAWWYILSFSCYELLLLHFPFELMYARQMRVIMFWSQENKSKEWRNSVSTTKKYMQYISCTHVLNTKKLRISLINKLSGLDTTSMSVIAIRVVEFSNGGYKIRKVFAYSHVPNRRVLA